MTPWGRPLAEWWRRLVAIVIDGVLLGIVSLFISFAFTIYVRGLVSLVLGIAYYGYMNGERGQTIGKMAMGIRVGREDNGGLIGFGQGALRYFVQWLLFLACVIPGIIDSLVPLSDARRQSWHDKVVHSVVFEA